MNFSFLRGSSEERAAFGGADTLQLFALVLHFGAGYGPSGPWALQVQLEPQVGVISYIYSMRFLYYVILYLPREPGHRTPACLAQAHPFA